jgi:hypothetical protein
MQRDLNITPSLPALLDDSNRELAAAILVSLRSTTDSTTVDTWRPTFYAQLGTKIRGSRSVFTERLTLEDILDQVLSGKSLEEVKFHTALTFYEHATDVLIPTHAALQANPVTLGQAFYNLDRSMLADEKEVRESRAMQLFQSLFGPKTAPKASTLPLL